MGKLKFTVRNASLTSNMLPTVIGSGYADEWTFSKDMFPQMAEKVTEMLNTEFPDGLADTGNDNADMAQGNALIAAVNARMQQMFVMQFGKKMLAKFAGKTVDGMKFDAGAEIYYWSNGGSEKGIVLSR